MEFTRFAHETPVQFRLDTTLTVTEPTTVVDGGAPTAARPGPYPVEAGTTWTFPAGADVPDVAGALPPGGDAWTRPLLDPGGGGHPVLSTLSLLMALVLGTMGLPHIIVRFHTSPDGRSARRTAAITVALLSVFYLFPGIYGTLGAVLVPELYLSGDTDTVVVALPQRVDGGPVGRGRHGDALGGRVRRVPRDLARAAARAVQRRRPRPAARRGPAAAAPGPARGRGRDRGAGAARREHRRRGARHRGLRRRRRHVLPAARARHLVAAAHRAGAVAGVVVGLVASVGAIGVDLFLGAPEGLASSLLGQPALWTVPLAFAVMVGVSLRGRPPAWAAAATLRLHLDEARLDVG